jgi:GR25 family glycosyltransferase involved in LPS biosynthesis
VKAYIVTLFNVFESHQDALRAQSTAAEFGIDAQLVSGVWRDDAQRELAAEGLKQAKFDESWSNTNAAMGNFVAQYRIWRQIEREGPAIIMEHDAVVVAPIPNLAGRGDIITLGKPSFGKLRKPLNAGFYPLFSSGDKIPGAHGYYLTPAGASALVSMARRKGAIPVDKFICPQRFHITEYYPWPIEAHDSFTTIQKAKGCLSKHNYGPEYKIL